MSSCIFNSNNDVKKFAKKITAFSAAFVICFLILSFWYEQRIVKNDLIYQHTAFFNNKNLDNDYLIIGNSQSAFDLRNEYLPSNFYNFSYNGESLRETYARLRKAFKKHKFHTVILSLNNHTMYERKNEERELEILNAFQTGISHNDIKSVWGVGSLEYLKLMMLSKLPLINALNRKLFVKVLIKDFFGKDHEKPYKFSSFGDIYYSEQKSWLTDYTPEYKKRVSDDYLTMMENYISDKPYMYDTLRDLFEFCSNNNIKLIVTILPTAICNMDLMRQIHNKFINSVFTDFYPIILLNYEDLFENKTEYFYDAGHLNENGSRIFSNIFANKITSLIEPVKDNDNSKFVNKGIYGQEPF